MRLHGDASDEEVEWALSQFVGEIYQTPPVRSSVARRPRIRTVYEIEVIERADREVLMRIASSGGTYIRKICHDLGLLLGFGAHMQELRRTRSGIITEREAYPLIDVYWSSWLWRNEGDDSELKRVVRPLEDLLAPLPRVEILDTAVDAICHGASLAAPGIARIESKIKRGDIVGVFTLKGECVSIGTALKSTEEILKEGGMAIKTERVIMERGTYPSVWRRAKKRQKN
jgi:H/ACA ribonucleoprotein complex subunit 4